MANQSLIAVPTNVEEPVVLQRFLLRLVEQIDINLGLRGDSTSLADIEKQLTDIEKQLTELTARVTALENLND